MLSKTLEAKKAIDLEAEKEFGKFEHEFAFEQSIFDEGQEEIARIKLNGDKQAKEKKEYDTRKNNEERSIN